MSTPKYLITTGNNFDDANLAKRNLLPEYTALYCGFNIISALKELPLILSGNPPPIDSLHTQVGLNDFSHKPEAVILGGGYNDQATKALLEACIKACEERGTILDVPFLRHSNKITNEQQERGDLPKRGTPEYAAVVARRLKDKLGEIESGEVAAVDGDGDGVLFF